MNSISSHSGKVTIVKPKAGDAISGVFINFVQDKRKARKIVDIKEIEKNEEFVNSDLQESNSEVKIEESNTES